MTTRRVIAAHAAHLAHAAIALLATLGALATPLAAQDTERLHIAVVGQSARVRTARLGTVLPERDVSLRGIDARVRVRGPLSIALRFHQSTLGGDDLTYSDVSALYALGGLIERVGGVAARDAVGDVAAELAYGSQAGYELTTGLAHGERHRFARLGVRASTPLAGSPLSLEVRMSHYLPAGSDGASEDRLSGFDGETAVRWTFAQWPADVALGYRLGRLDVYRAAQEVSSLRLEVAWRGLGTP